MTFQPILHPPLSRSHEAREGHKVSPSVAACLVLSILFVWFCSCLGPTPAPRVPDSSYTQLSGRCTGSELRPSHLHIKLFSPLRQLPRLELLFLQGQRIFDSGKEIRVMLTSSPGVPIASVLVYTLSASIACILHEQG